MPKLITKQNVIRRSWWQRYGGRSLSIAGLSLLLMGAAATLLPTDTPLTTYSTVTSSSTQTRLPDFSIPSTHQIFRNVLLDLQKEYEQIAKKASDSYEVNLNLMGKAESILLHLDKMNQQMQHLPEAERVVWQANESEYAYQVDYWRSQLHFRRLRLSRFGNGELPIARDYPLYIEGEDFLAVNPDGILPLSESEVGTTPLFQEPLQPPGTLSAGFNSMMVHTQEPLSHDAMMLGVAGVNTSEETPPKRRFQFAKPPPGVQLPGDFCNLSDPAASCKPSGNLSFE